MNTRRVTMAEALARLLENQHADWDGEPAGDRAPFLRQLRSALRGGPDVRSAPATGGVTMAEALARLLEDRHVEGAGEPARCLAPFQRQLRSALRGTPDMRNPSAGCRVAEAFAGFLKKQHGERGGEPAVDRAPFLCEGQAR
jgi:hypothetical protein